MQHWAVISSLLIEKGKEGNEERTCSAGIRRTGLFL
jgi:hypothetical protein